MSTVALPCPVNLMIAGENFPCDLDSDHYGLAHSNRKAQAIWQPIPMPPLQQLAPYAVWAEHLSDDEIEHIIRGRE